jgi:hypothetical protein
MEKKYICEKCEVGFNHQSSYCRHKKKCQPTENQKPTKSELENQLMQSEMEKIQLENKLLKFELQNIMPAEEPRKTHKKIKECNITFKEFTDSIELTSKTLDTIIILGYVKGMTNIIFDRLDKLEERPIYCTDTRRVLIYLMEESWVKNEKQMIDFVKEMDKKIYSIYNQLPPYPAECEKKLSFALNMCQNNIENQHKIIRNIAKYVMI